MDELKTRQDYLTQATEIEQGIYTYEVDVIGNAIMEAQDWFDTNSSLFSEEVRNTLGILLDAGHNELGRAIADDLRGRGDFFCLDCDFDCLEGEEYYVLNEILRESSRDGMLCVGCREIELGRPLVWDDFNRCPLNDDNLEWAVKSERLQSRLAKTEVV